MVQKEHLLLKIVSLILIVTCSSCYNKSAKEEVVIPSSFVVNTTMIPIDTILSTNKDLKLDNGIVYLSNTVYSGYIQQMYENDQIKDVFSYYKGKQEGASLTYFPNGKLKDSRSYKAGKSYGRHYGYWSNGNLKYDFVYNNDKREGLQKQWYESGGKYSFLTFKNDTEDGMQKAWRENGKPYINYQAKDGHRYGLQKSNLCYTLLDGKLKLPTNENK
ncbi:hypothetical protein BJQ96_00147 [Flavobacterium sp. PL0002]|nr:hypothetical protein [Flavobacterium sp. PL002]